MSKVPYSSDVDVYHGVFKSKFSLCSQCSQRVYGKT